MPFVLEPEFSPPKCISYRSEAECALALDKNFPTSVLQATMARLIVSGIDKEMG